MTLFSRGALGPLALTLAAAITPDALVVAVKAGATEDVARIARRLGPVKLRAMLARPETALAALVAAPTLDDAWVLLPDITGRLPDAAAARAAAHIAAGLRADPRRAEREEPDDEILVDARQACAATADATNEPTTVREDGLRCAYDLGDREIAVRLATAVAPELRRAAVALLAAGAEREREPELAALRGAGADPDDGVAGLALHGLCARSLLSDPERERARALAAVEEVDRGLRVALARCLTASERKRSGRAGSSSAEPPASSGPPASTRLP